MKRIYSIPSAILDEDPTLYGGLKFIGTGGALAVTLFVVGILVINLFI
jgi:hypothetical protein